MQNIRVVCFVGNENLHKLTSQGKYQLHVDLEDWENETRYALYDVFQVGDELSNYTLKIGGYSGNAGIKSFTTYM